MDWMILPLRRYADFRGRSRRAEFWWWTLLYYIITAVLLAITFSGFPWEAIINESLAPDLIEDDPFEVFGAGLWVGAGLYGLFFLATFIPNLAVTVRRLHDRGMSGWWYGGLLIASFIPVIDMLAFFGYIALFIICILPGQEGANRWGPDPKDPSQASVFA
ncbi:DUF805 domain-containing protein [Erythrobacter sp. GH3-10]|uniref:DUF805 domain-containing protein n=1 Tax=Aurantiacibacter rhizosphaerae TaxID=2691582 RepID=A0A844XCP0_9SPHN|nr:DUF805 domain-containing protein [Aurantiacibacter rhizosphaerae]